ncbi:MAG: DUF3047 domain-containing protein [Nitrospira sp.]|nr:DUF3047 domain-containing protein [Nitrospira sp.]
MTREIRIDPKDYPIIRWQWKVSNVLKAGDVAHKAGDDYPARIYVTSEYDSEKVGLFGTANTTAKLIYGRYPCSAPSTISGRAAPIGTTVPNPFTDQVYTIVESGTTCSIPGHGRTHARL